MPFRPSTRAWLFCLPLLLSNGAGLVMTSGNAWAQAPAVARVAETLWRLDRDRDGITVQTRPVPGSGIREFRGTAEVAASVEAIRALLRDADRFHTWFPDTSESRLLERTGDVSYQYSVLDTPWPITDRDNVFRAETTRDETTGVVAISVQAAPDRHPERPDRVRVRHARGEWRLEPIAVERTRVVFTMHLDPGGGVPQWLINARVVETPFEALRNLRATLAAAEG
ncbi:MAG: START domain-containing protein [Myxococcota bacterium]